MFILALRLIPPRLLIRQECKPFNLEMEFQYPDYPRLSQSNVRQKLFNCQPAKCAEKTVKLCELGVLSGFIYYDGNRHRDIEKALPDSLGRIDFLKKNGYNENQKVAITKAREGTVTPFRLAVWVNYR